MATMSHTPAQRKQWHAGKRKPHESKWAAFVRVHRMKGTTAFTPTWAKKGIAYG